MSLRPAKIESKLSALDIRRPIRYARARVYSIAVRAHAAVYFPDRSPSGRAAAGLWLNGGKQAWAEREAAQGVSSTCAPMADREYDCEVFGGPDDCLCVRAVSAAEVQEKIDALCDKHKIPYMAMTPAPFTGTPYDPNSEED